MGSGRGSKQKGRKSERRAPGVEPIVPADLMAMLPQSLPVEIVQRVTGPEAAVALIGSLAEMDPPRLDVLEALRDAFPAKPVQKALRKACFILERRGVVVERLRRQAEEPSVLQGLARGAVANGKAVLSHIMDLRGTRVLDLAYRTPGGDWRVFMGMVAAQDGFLEHSCGILDRRRVQEMFRDVLGDKGMVTTDLPHAIRVLELARRRHLELYGHVPRDYLELRPQLLRMAAPLEEADFRDRLVELVGDGGSVLTESGLEALVDDPLMAYWFLDPELLKDYMLEESEVLDSPLVLSRTTEAERLQTIRERACTEFFDQTQTEQLAGNLREMVYVFAKLEQMDLARVCLVAARSLEQPLGVEGRRLLRMIVDRSFSLVNQSLEERLHGPDDKEPAKGDAPALILPR